MEGDVVAEDGEDAITSFLSLAGRMVGVLVALEMDGRIVDDRPMDLDKSRFGHTQVLIVQ